MREETARQKGDLLGLISYQVVIINSTSFVLYNSSRFQFPALAPYSRIHLARQRNVGAHGSFEPSRVIYPPSLCSS